MIISKNNPSELSLEVKVLNPDGSIKTNISTATVRVYHLASGVEVIDLIPTSLIQVGTTNTWRYVWAPASLTANTYTAEYTLIDDTSLTTITGEDITVGYLESNISALQSDITIIKNIETGKWAIVNNQLLLYGPDNTTLIATFNLFDSEGNPTSDSPTSRVKV